MGLLVAIVVLAVVAFLGVGIYNRLVTSHNTFKDACAQIDVQLTRRNDLIPNLVETATGHLQHERATLEAVFSARNTAVAGLKASAKCFPIPCWLAGSASHQRACSTRLRLGYATGAHPEPMRGSLHPLARQMLVELRGDATPIPRAAIYTYTPQ